MLLAPGTGYTDPVQGVVLGAGAGAAIGGGAGAAVGAVLGGAGGAAAQSKEQEERARWQNYYEQQEKEEARQGASLVLQPSGPEPPLPTGSGLIKEIQRSLIALGYDPGPVDGLTDGDTVDAIRAYQEASGLMTTGRASIDLLQHMRQRGVNENRLSSGAGSKGIQFGAQPSEQPARMSR